MSNKAQNIILSICAVIFFSLLGLYMAFFTADYVVVTLPDTPQANVMDMLQSNGESRVWFEHIRTYKNGQYLIWVKARHFGGLSDIAHFMIENDIHYMYAGELR